MEKDSFIIIDSNSLVNRAFYAMTGMTTSRGEPVGAAYGFTVMLVKLIEEFKPKYVAAVFDVHAPTFRHKLTPIYKATRKPMPPELAAQFSILKDILKAMNIKTYELEGYEADDIIGTLTKERGVFKYIVTSDRDSLQLVDDTTHVLLTRRGITDLGETGPKDVPNVFGVPAERVVDFKALAGDASDNIPGVAGIGDKSAAELINLYGSIDGIYSNLDKIYGARRDKLEAGKDSAYLSYKLAAINRDTPIPYELDECKLCFPFPPAVREIFDRYEFKSLLKKSEIFASEETAPTKKTHTTETVALSSYDEIPEIFENASDVAILFTKDGLHLAHNGKTDYFAPITNDLFSTFTFSGCVEALTPILGKHIISFDLKSLLHAVYPKTIDSADDVGIMNYLLEYRIAPENAAELFAAYTECKMALSAKNMTKLYSDIELPLVRVLFDMERTGFTIDKAKLEDIDKHFTALENENKRRVREIYGKDFNLNSPKQLAAVLFEDLKIPYPGKPPYSTKAEILQQLAGEYEIVDEILKYRFHSKIKSTFVDGMRNAVTKDGTVHTTFNQTTTATGRLSSAEPNLQNIPTRSDEGRVIRSMFVPRPGNLLVDADYSQIELKLLAHYSADEKMIDTFVSGGDIHRSTAAEVFGVAPDEVTPAMRRDAKAVNFGIVYGISDFGLGRNIHIPAKKAKAYIDKYFERFPKVKAFLDYRVESAKALGYAVTEYGRRRAIPELTSAKYLVRKFGERVAMNMPLQGTAADIIKIAMINVHKRLSGMQAKLVLQVHDELLIDAPESEVETVKDILKTEMENAAKLSVPLNVDIAVGRNWMECK